MKRERSARILATLGPASASRERIRELADAGADVFRLNFSHGSHADHAERLQQIREVEQEIGRPIGVLMDLQGPKLRVGRFAEGKVVRSAEFGRAVRKCSGTGLVLIQHQSDPDPVLFTEAADDGRIYPGRRGAVRVVDDAGPLAAVDTTDAHRAFEFTDAGRVEGHGRHVEHGEVDVLRPRRASDKQGCKKEE